jgi:hypothetical protein
VPLRPALEAEATSLLRLSTCDAAPAGAQRFGQKEDMMAYGQGDGNMCHYQLDATKLEIITVCYRFDDILKVTLAENHGHADSYIVVTDHADHATQDLCQRFSVRCVPTDLLKKNGRNFNKGAAINHGFGHFQYHGWRLHLDTDVLLPDSFRRMLFNHSNLERDCIYGADRFDIIGKDGVSTLREAKCETPQHMFHSGVSPVYGGKVYPKMPSASSARFISDLYGYVPIGFFQLWHASCQRPYPYGLGTAAHDDVMFGASWPEAKRRLLPSVFVGHVCGKPPSYAENWDGKRGQPRIDGNEK